VEPERARELLAAERRRLEELLDGRKAEPTEELSLTDSADAGTDTFDAELDESLAEELRAGLEAVERAEQRLGEGTYGLSVETGEPIPDERLEAFPAAERTAAEQARHEGRAG
jgi:RNA polymerase-binding transcription factor